MAGITLGGQNKKKKEKEYDDDTDSEDDDENDPNCKSKWRSRFNKIITSLTADEGRLNELGVSCAETELFRMKVYSVVAVDRCSDSSVAMECLEGGLKCLQNLVTDLKVGDEGLGLVEQLGKAHDEGKHIPRKHNSMKSAEAVATCASMIASIVHHYFTTRGDDVLEEDRAKNAAKVLKWFMSPLMDALLTVCTKSQSGDWVLTTINVYFGCCVKAMRTIVAWVSEERQLLKEREHKYRKLSAELEQCNDDEHERVDDLTCKVMDDSCTLKKLKQAHGIDDDELSRAIASACEHAKGLVAAPFSKTSDLSTVGIAMAEKYQSDTVQLYVSLLSLKSLKDEVKYDYDIRPVLNLSMNTQTDWMKGKKLEQRVFAELCKPSASDTCGKLVSDNFLDVLQAVITAAVDWEALESFPSMIEQDLSHFSAGEGKDGDAVSIDGARAKSPVVKCFWTWVFRLGELLVKNGKSGQATVEIGRALRDAVEQCCGGAGADNLLRGSLEREAWKRSIFFSKICQVLKTCTTKELMGRSQLVTVMSKVRRRLESFMHMFYKEALKESVRRLKKAYMEMAIGVLASLVITCDGDPELEKDERLQIWQVKGFLFEVLDRRAEVPNARKRDLEYQVWHDNDIRRAMRRNSMALTIIAAAEPPGYGAEKRCKSLLSSGWLNESILLAESIEKSGNRYLQGIDALEPTYLDKELDTVFSAAWAASDKWKTAMASLKAKGGDFARVLEQHGR